MRNLTSFSLSLHIIVGGLLLLAAFSGVVSTFLWMDTEKRWDAHLHRAESLGMQIHWSQENDRPAPAGISIDQISVEDDKLARAGKFSLMSSVSSADLVTQLSLSGVTESGDRSHISLAITSPDLRYPVGRVVSNGQGTKMSLAEKLGQISVLVASYCSDATVYMKYDGRPWVRVKADAVWSCAAAPLDHRLSAGLFMAVAMIALLATAKSVSGSFSDFAGRLQRGTTTDPLQPFTEQGPSELRGLIRGINHFISRKSHSLERRARFLAGVSHDLGTPATRLRLRASLVEDAELRGKIDSDIEAMTGMIESVLNYTQSEINVEAKRRVSLLSIVESIVADFQDDAQPVTLAPYVLPKVKPQTLL
ncbi:MAG: histidine kinase dimerization/phospho-acceptor domain-containing protein, partial [Candidatus Puniceispirillaceae bacterium]